MTPSDLEEAVETAPTEVLATIVAWLYDAILSLQKEAPEEGPTLLAWYARRVEEAFPVTDIESLSRAVRVLDGILVTEVVEPEASEDILDTALGMLIWARENERTDILDRFRGVLPEPEIGELEEWIDDLLDWDES